MRRIAVEEIKVREKSVENFIMNDSKVDEVSCLVTERIEHN